MTEIYWVSPLHEASCFSTSSVASAILFSQCPHNWDLETESLRDSLTIYRWACQSHISGRSLKCLALLFLASPSFATYTCPCPICCWNVCDDVFLKGVYLSSINIPCWRCVCILQQKWLLWNQVNLWLFVLLVWFQANKYELSKTQQDWVSNRMFSSRGMKSNYCCVMVLKYLIFFNNDDKNVYCVSLAKKKRKRKKTKAVACSLAFEFL